MNQVLKYISEATFVTYEEFTQQIIAMTQDGYTDALWEVEDLMRHKIIAKDIVLGGVFRTCETQLVVWRNKLWTRSIKNPPNLLERGYIQNCLSEEKDRFYIHPLQTFVVKIRGIIYRVKRHADEQLKSQSGTKFFVTEIDEVIQYDQVPKNTPPQAGLKSSPPRRSVKD